MNSQHQGSPQAKKKFGQHFLHDRGIISKILDLLEGEPNERILEIGPGPGTLTIPLNQRGFGLRVVEIDRDMVSFLGTQCFEPPVEIIHQDFLKMELAGLVTEQTKVLSNLPYNVSVPITAKLLEVVEFIPLMVLMYQKEVAERIQAGPGSKDYGPISVLVQFFYEIDAGFNVAPGAFRPPPKVQSRVIRLRRRESYLIEPSEIGFAHQLLNLLFGQRRKMVQTSLKKRKRVHWLDVYRDLGPEKARPEDLSPQFYAEWLHRILEGSC